MNDIANYITPIETEYKGYLFHTRLEARWAVFFDACGVKWEYEPEGFDLSNGIYYLPDFLLHDVYTHRCNGLKYLGNLWVEVKRQITASDAYKIEAFSNVVEDDGFLTSIERPIFIATNISDGETFWDLIECMVQLAYNGNFARYPFNFGLICGDSYPAFPTVDNQGRFVIAGGDRDYLDNVDERATMEAYKLARQARFEHKRRQFHEQSYFNGQLNPRR